MSLSPPVYPFGGNARLLSYLFHYRKSLKAILFWFLVTLQKYNSPRYIHQYMENWLIQNLVSKQEITWSVWELILVGKFVKLAFSYPKLTSHFLLFHFQHISCEHSWKYKISIKHLYCIMINDNQIASFLPKLLLMYAFFSHFSPLLF